MSNYENNLWNMLLSIAKKTSLKDEVTPDSSLCINCALCNNQCLFSYCHLFRKMKDRRKENQDADVERKDQEREAHRYVCVFP